MDAPIINANCITLESCVSIEVKILYDAIITKYIFKV